MEQFLLLRRIVPHGLHQLKHEEAQLGVRGALQHRDGVLAHGLEALKLRREQHEGVLASHGLPLPEHHLGFDAFFRIAPIHIP